MSRNRPKYPHPSTNGKAKTTIAISRRTCLSNVRDAGCAYDQFKQTVIRNACPNQAAASNSTSAKRPIRAALRDGARELGASGLRCGDDGGGSGERVDQLVGPERL